MSLILRLPAIKNVWYNGKLRRNNLVSLQRCRSHFYVWLSHSKMIGITLMWSTKYHIDNTSIIMEAMA